MNPTKSDNPVLGFLDNEPLQRLIESVGLLVISIYGAVLALQLPLEQEQVTATQSAWARPVFWLTLVFYFYLLIVSVRLKSLPRMLVPHHFVMVVIFSFTLGLSDYYKLSALCLIPSFTACIRNLVWFRKNGYAKLQFLSKEVSSFGYLIFELLPCIYVLYLIFSHAATIHETGFAWEIWFWDVLFGISVAFYSGGLVIASLARRLLHSSPR